MDRRQNMEVDVKGVLHKNKPMMRVKKPNGRIANGRALLIKAPHEMRS
jgi:hypothetical protein